MPEEKGSEKKEIVFKAEDQKCAETMDINT